MKKLLLSAIALITSYLSVAQTGNFVANYTYQINSGTYTALTTPTVLSSGSGMDDAFFTVTLSSPFNFNGANATSFVVTENGYISVGTDPDTYNPLSTTTSGNLGILAAFGRDLGGIDATSQLAWAEVGNEAIFEWKNVKRYLSSSGEILNFQIRLNKSNGVIKFVYGPTSLAAGSSGTYPQVGIRGASTTWATDLNNLTISNTTGNCSWANATAGSANSSTMYFDNANSAVAPASGLQYIWTPSTLTPPVRTIAAVSGISTNSVVLNFTQPAGTPTGYNVQYRPVNACSWTNVPGNPYAAASSINLTGLSSGTQYEYRIQAIFGAGNSIYSHIPSTFTTLSAACTGAPNAGTAVASSASVCSATNFTLSLSGSSTGVTGLTYQWQSSPDGSTWSNITATTNSAVVSQTATTYYQLVLTCTGSAQSATSTPVMVSMNNFLNCYCVTTPGTVNTVDIITGVTLVNSLGSVFTQTSSAVSPNFVTYNNTPVDLVRGSTTNTISITYGTDGTQYGAAWIDFNKNGVYEASEVIGLASSSAGSSATVNYSFTVPAGASLGNTRMRVRGGDDAAYTAAGACTSSAYGETEDYMVNIITPPTCYMPTALTATNISASGVKLSWTAPASGTPVSYVYEIRTSGAAGSGATGLATTGTVTAPSTSVSVSGLSASTAYTVYIVTNCGAGDFSVWTPALTFTTLANCPVPTGLNVTGVTATGAVSTWTAGASETAWDVYYGTSPLTVPTASTAATATTSTSSYSLTGLTPSTPYEIYVRANCGTGNTSVWTPVSTFTTSCLSPNVISTAGGVICGIGNTTVTASADMGGSIVWYANPTGGSPIATGTVYATPSITTNTTYYAAAVGNLAIENVGRASASSSSGFLTTPDWGIQFSTTKNVLINSATIYPVGTGSVTIALLNASGTELASTASLPVTGTGTNSPVVVNLGFSVPAGTGYRLALKAYSGITDLIRDGSGNTFPYTSASGAISVTAGWNGSASSSYYWFYNLNVSSGCESPRTAVTATVNTAPALTASTGTTVCANVIQTLNITSNVSNFNSYIWSPTSNLYTDAAATNQYSGGSATTLYYKSASNGSTTYSITANNSTSGCVNVTSLTMASTMPSIIASATPTNVCSGSTVSLTANTSVVAAGTMPVGTNTASTSGSGASGGSYISPFSHYFGGYKGLYIIRASELQSAGFSAGNITSLAYSVTSTGTTYTDFSISMGATTQSVVGGSFIASLPQVYGPNNVTPVVGVNTYNFSSPYNWDGVSNIAVQVCWSNNNTGGLAAEVRYGPTTFASTAYFRGDDLTSADVCSETITDGTISNRPLLILGGQVATQGAGTVNWTWNPGAINSNTATVTPVNTGTSSTTESYTVTALDPANTCTNSAVVTVTVNPIPTVTAMTSTTLACTGSNVTLTANGANTYSWSAGGNTQTVTVVPSGNTTYTVTGTSNGCSSTATVSISTIISPSVTATASQTLLCSDGSTGSSVLTANTAATSYTWSTGDNTQTSTVTPSTTTVYTVTVSDGTCNNSATVTITVSNCTGIKEAVANGISVYPNPNNGIVNFAVNAELSGNTTVEIYDAIGKLVIKENLNKEITTINTNHLQDGVYFFKIKNNNQEIKVGKMIKQ